MPIITALYAGILGLISIVLAGACGRLRGNAKVSIGDGGDKNLLLAMRRHANFVEYVPLALILIALLELNGVRHVAIHSLGAALVVARINHAVGIKADRMITPGRLMGAALTIVVTSVSSIWAIALFVSSLH